MDVIQKVTAIIEAPLVAMGYDIVLIRMSDNFGRKTLTLMAERKDGVNMSFDDCTEISRMASALLEVEDPISTAYDLEVCSPGLDRPLTKFADYKKYAGYEAKIETMLPIDGRKRFRGKIKASGENSVLVEMPEGNAEIKFENIRGAKLTAADIDIGIGKKKKK